MNDKYKGMTVNERLFVSGHMDEFDLSVKMKDTNKAKEILAKVDIIDPLTIESILKQVGLHYNNS